MSQPIAVIDLGTNTARLLIASQLDNGSIHTHLLLRSVTRLGGGFTRMHGISAEAADRTIEALRIFTYEMNRLSVGRVKAVATSAVRDAVNGSAFVSRVGQETGISLDVIDGQTEALLTLRGVVSGLPNPNGRYFIFDIGGGSTEYTLAEEQQAIYTCSLPLGVVRLTEGKADALAMKDKIDREISSVHLDLQRLDLLHSLSSYSLVGTAGTATTLAAIHLGLSTYNHRLVNNHQICLDDITSIHARLCEMTPEDRLTVPGLEKGREDLIIAGTILSIQTMQRFGYSQLTVSDLGLLEGLLLDVIQ